MIHNDEDGDNDANDGDDDERLIIEEEDGEWIHFLGGNSSSGTKKYRGSNSSDGGNAGEDQNSMEVIGYVVVNRIEVVDGVVACRGCFGQKGGDVAQFGAKEGKIFVVAAEDRLLQDTSSKKIAADISLALDSVKSPFIQLASFTIFVSVIYAALVGDKAIMCSIIASQLHAHPCIINPYLMIDLPMTVIDLPMA
ncbi:hypothetical protein Tco_0861680 [Tanacetum coccineum]|uniref:Uncharacterized protein n=1 Tax=Tanacetum coccineum TaxID=301880 RepID=A0ABQ5BLF7_9ASTR